MVCIICLTCLICLCLWIDVTPCPPRRGVTPGCYAGVVQQRAFELGYRVVTPDCYVGVAAPGLLYCHIVTLYFHIATFLNCHDATLPHCYIATFS